MAFADGCGGGESEEGEEGCYLGREMHDGGLLPAEVCRGERKQKREEKQWQWCFVAQD